MFAAFIAGKLVQSDFQQVSETQFALNFTSLDKINHVVVFMTGQIPFPEGYGGGIYFGMPENGNMSWHFLGVICNEKPSAIYKVNKLQAASSINSPFFIQNASGDSNFAQLGISIEPLVQLSQMVSPENTQVSTLNTFSQFTIYMMNNLVNYLGSFANNDQMVHMTTVQRWFELFQQKMIHNPYFWK